MRTILLICTGNTCRSPLAEAVARWCAREGKLPVPADQLFFCSAGVMAAEGLPPSLEALAVLDTRKIPHSGLSKPLTAEMIHQAHLVLGMTQAHLTDARALIGGDEAQAAKILPLDPNGDIADPIGASQSVYDSLVETFLELIPTRLTELLEKDSPPSA